MYRKWSKADEAYYWFFYISKAAACCSLERILDFSSEEIKIYEFPVSSFFLFPFAKSLVSYIKPKDLVWWQISFARFETLTLTVIVRKIKVVTLCW